MQVNNYSNTNFKAIKLATAKNVLNNKTTNIEIYQLTRKDNNFLKKLMDKIDYKKLYPNLTEHEQKVWQDIFKYTIFNSMDKNNTSLIAISENKPCGIICYSKKRFTNLIGLCAIPINKEEKVPFVGKSLFLHLFQDAIKNKTKGIKLEAVNDSPIDVIKKYTSLGFKKTSSEGRYTQMEINNYKIKSMLNSLKEFISYEETKPKNINLDFTFD